MRDCLWFFAGVAYGAGFVVTYNVFVREARKLGERVGLPVLMAVTWPVMVPFAVAIHLLSLTGPKA